MSAGRVPEKATETISKRVSPSTPTPAQETNPVKKYWAKRRAGERSMRLAVNAMCAHCMGCTEDWREPGFVDLVRNCTAPHCPLYDFRPYQVGRGATQ